MSKAEDRRQSFIKWAQAHDNKITSREAYEIGKHWYYCNYRHHIGEILSRLVKAGVLRRDKPGHFTLVFSSKLPAHKADERNPNQQNLF